MFGKIRLILSVLGLISILAACSAQSTSTPLTDLPSRNLSPPPTPQSNADTQTGSTFVCQNIEDISVEECQVLVTLYETTDGDHWLDNTGWLVDRTACTWYGVICQQGHVVELQLYYNELAGSLPPEIEKLAHLKSLYLDANQLSGPLPPEIGNLTELEVARLGKNQFSSSIPAEIVDLKKLIFLELWGNQLSGEIPGEPGNLSKLQELRLNSNQFTGSIPPALGNLGNLTHLDLSHNQLSGSIPTELEEPPVLSWLDLSYNQLTCASRPMASLSDTQALWLLSSLLLL